MARRVPTPQELLDQLRRLLPHPPEGARRDAPSSDDRILDAALAAFTEHGVKATTMTRIARDAGVSREWLYRRFPGRDAVVVAVARREAQSFMEGLAHHSVGALDVTEAVTDAFVYSVEFLRDNEVLQRVLRTEPEIVTGKVLHDASPMVGMAVQTGAGYLTVLGGLPAAEATVVAETLVRLVASIVLAPAGALDLHDPARLRAYAATVVPAIVTATSVASRA